MLLQTWGQVLTNSFQNLWYGVISFVPNLLVAIVIFIFGWLIGTILGRWVEQLIKSLRVDKALEEVGTDELLARAGFRLNAGAFIGGLVKWFIIIVFLLASVEVLGLVQVSDFLHQIVLGFLPNVIVAALVLLVAAVLADALQRVVTGSAMAAGITSAKFLGGIAKWAIWIFALIAALLQLGVAVVLLQTLFTGLVAMLALAGGLAFGLGGRDAAARYIEKLRDEVGARR
jgi:small-conductance mechanosensitive channel